MTPAQFTHSSSRPKRSTARCASCSTAGWLRTSVGTASALAPSASHSAATPRRGPAARAARTRREPSRANRTAAARPIPLEAPVMTTTQRARSRGTPTPLPRSPPGATGRPNRRRRPRSPPLEVAAGGSGHADASADRGGGSGGVRTRPRRVRRRRPHGACARVVARGRRRSDRALERTRLVPGGRRAHAARDRGADRGARRGGSPPGARPASDAPRPPHPRAGPPPRRAPPPPPPLVPRLTGAPVHRCGASAAATVAETVGAVGERLVHAEEQGPEVARALRLVSGAPSFLRAVRTRDAAALRAAIVRFFEVKRLHIVRVRAVTASGRLVGDVGGPYVLAPASRAIRVRGRIVGRVTLSIQDDAGYVKLMRRFTGAAVVLRAGGRVLPVSARMPPGGRVVGFAVGGRRGPAGRLDVALLVPLAPT